MCRQGGRGVLFANSSRFAILAVTTTNNCGSCLGAARIRLNSSQPSHGWRAGRFQMWLSPWRSAYPYYSFPAVTGVQYRSLFQCDSRLSAARI
eukprot:95114-Pyramimonas_sp.AAC.1